MSDLRHFFPATIVAVAALIASQTSAQDKNANDTIQISVIEGQADSIRSAIETINKIGEQNENVTQRLKSSQQAEARALQATVVEYFVQHAGNPEESMIGQLKLLNDVVAAAATCEKSRMLEDADDLREKINELKQSLQFEDKSDQPAKADDQAVKEPGDEKKVEKPEGKSKDEDENYVVTYTNEYRAKLGLPPLKFDAELCDACKDHSADMNRLKFFSHQSPITGKTRFTDRAKRSGTTASAENIASGATSGKAALELWLNSQHHRASIEGNYRRIGIGRSDGYYTQMFGK